LATALRDAGKIEEAKGLLNLNSIELERYRYACEAKNVTIVVPVLLSNFSENKMQAAEIGDNLTTCLMVPAN